MCFARHFSSGRRSEPFSHVPGDLSVKLLVTGKVALRKPLFFSPPEHSRAGPDVGTTSDRCCSLFVLLPRDRTTYFAALTFVRQGSLAIAADPRVFQEEFQLWKASNQVAVSRAENC